MAKISYKLGVMMGRHKLTTATLCAYMLSFALRTLGQTNSASGLSI